MINEVELIKELTFYKQTFNQIEIKSITYF
jgi:hypothetical protein